MGAAHSETREFLTPELSIFLDAFRFFATLVVVFFHVREGGLFLGDPLIIRPAHEAVIGFFVLSGIVISKTARKPTATLSRFTIDRITRVYSVTVPAIAFAIIAGWVLYFMGADRPQKMSGLLDVLSSLLFLNESWTNASNLWANTPYWSLCYEVWYYVVFAIWAFLRGSQRYAWLLVAGLIAGPAVLLLLPAWLVGTVLDRYPVRLRLNIVVALLLAVLPIAVIFLVADAGLRLTLREEMRGVVPGLWWFRRSQDFLYDIGTAVLFGVHFIGMRAFLRRAPGLMLGTGTVFRDLGATTLSIYLFHFPIVLLLRAAGVSTGSNFWAFIALSMGVVGICMVFSRVTEARRKAWEPLATAIVALGGRRRAVT